MKGRRMLSRMVWSVWFAIVAIGCGGSSGGDGQAPGGDASSGDATRHKFMRLVQDGDGTQFICEDVDPSSPGFYDAHDCVKKDTGEPHECKIITDESGGTKYHCVPKPKGQTDDNWSPPCTNYKQFGDHKAGLDCWDPPENYCKDGCDTMLTWFCSPDAGKCCRSGCDCFLCGWVKVIADITGSNISCTVAGESQPRPQSFCDEFWAKVPQSYKNCITGSCPKEDLDKIVEDPDCAGPDPSLLICD